MRTLIKSISIAAMALSLASCNSLTASQQALINQIQQGAVTTCGFMPTLETALSLLGQGGAAEVIKIVCATVAPAGPPTAAAAAPSRFGQAVHFTTPAGKSVDGMFVR